MHALARGLSCPNCYKKYSNGEQRCSTILNSLNIEHNIHVKFPWLPKSYTFDMSFIYNNINYIIEYDGQQHFDLKSAFYKFYNDSLSVFEKSRARDAKKTILALKNNYRIIRIDDRSFKTVEYHIQNALNSPYIIYFSKPDRYQWIIDEMKKENIDINSTVFPSDKINIITIPIKINIIPKSNSNNSPEINTSKMITIPKIPKMPILKSN